MPTTRFMPLIALATFVMVAAVHAQSVTLYSDVGTNFAQLGEAVSHAGDVDGDGTPDFMAGARGSVTVYSGADGTVIHYFSDPTLNSIFGSSLGVGDVDGDGFDDVIVGAPGGLFGGVLSGRADVYSGADGSLLHSVGGSPGDAVGTSVSGAGDIDGDGFDDFLVCAPSDDTFGTNVGAARIYSGANGAVLMTFAGSAAAEGFGRAASGGGDVDGDGVPDVVIGSPWAAPNGADSGRVRVYSGATGTMLYSFDGDGSGDEFGFAVSILGDANGDGYSDLLVGARRDDDGGSNAGRVSVISGFDGSTLHTLDGFSAGEEFGRSAAFAGDIDGDGRDDIIAGAPYATTNGANSGRVRIHSGADGSLLHSFTGETASAHLGFAVGATGDVNGDHTDDFIITNLDDGSGFYRGRIRVMSGSPFVGSAVTPATGALFGSQTVTITGAGLAGITSVAFDGVPALSITILNDQSLEAVTPGRSTPGIVDVTLTDGVFSSTIVGGFEYLLSFTISAVTPPQGDVLGHKVVTFSGTDLGMVTGISFDGMPAIGMTLVNDQTIEVVTPPHGAGPVDVMITDASSAFTMPSAFTYVSSCPCDLYVPSIFPTIQSAIDFSNHGDTVVVDPGTYYENISFNGRAITVRSSGGAAVTTIDGGLAGAVVTFANGEGPASVLRGLTIRNGLGATGATGAPGTPGIAGNPFFPVIPGSAGGIGGGGGIDCYAASPRIIDCVITDNQGGQGGTGGAGGSGGVASAGGPGGPGGAGGVSFFGQQPNLLNCVVTRNTGGAGGPGGAGGTDSMGAAAPGAPGRGGAGGILLYNVGTTITSSTVALNTGGAGPGSFTEGAGGLLNVGGASVVANSIFRDNVSTTGEIDHFTGTLILNACNVQGGFPGTNNIDLDAGFVDPVNGDFHLTHGSPCVDAGDAGAAGLQPTDFDGDPRIIGTTVDIGADEFQLQTPYLGTGEDFVLTTEVDGVPTPVFQIKDAVAGDDFVVAYDSPNGTFVATQTALIAQPFLTGSAPGSPFPGVHINPFVTPVPVVIFDGGSSLFGPALMPPGGFEFPFVIPAGLSGWSFLTQAFSLTGTATNGIFASTHGNEVRVL